MTARGELMQAHLDKWQTFSTVGGAPFGTQFVDQVDMQNVGTMGHSRGGEGVVRNFQINQALGSPYGIKAVLPLAPVDFFRPVINKVAQSVILPVCDGDVSTCRVRTSTTMRCTRWPPTGHRSTCRSS